MEASLAPGGAAEQPATVHTFLIADIRGYTRFTLDHGDEAAARLAATFAGMANEAVSAHGGTVIELRGDEALAVFASARQALRAAVFLQSRLLAAATPELPLRAGVGLDAGEAIPVGGGFRGASLNLAARLCSLAGPGEILASDTVTNLARKLEGLEYGERGLVDLKGFSEPVRVMEIRVPAPQPDLTPSPSDPLPGETVALTSSGDPGDAVDARLRLPIGGFLGSLPSGPLVGRDTEVAVALRAIDAVTTGEGRTILLAGEPGAGKTRLGQEITLQLRNRGFLIGAGRCYEAEAAVPYYPFLDALGALYHLAPGDVQRDASRRWPYLGALLPDQIGTPEVMGGSGDDEQLRIFRAVGGFLEAIANNDPVALLLDDLHWADSASLKLLLYLAQHSRTMPVFLLGTYRDVEVGRQHPLEAALYQLNREGLAERIAVRRLTAGGTRDLIAATMGEEEPISEEFTALVHGRTDGNPFFVQHVLRVLVERGDVFRKDGHWDRKEIGEIEVPESVRAVIGQRLSRLTEDTQAMLHEASVLGQTFAFDDLQAMSGRDEDALEAGLEEAIAAGLLSEARGDSYAFDHALTQQALYQELSARRRRRLHLAAGKAFEASARKRRSHTAAELAWHFLQGDAPEQALRYSLQAGREAAAVFAHVEAEEHLRAALELARELGDEPATADALSALGEELGYIAQYQEACELLREAGSLYRRQGNAARELETADVLSDNERGRGEGESAIEYLREVLGRLEHTPGLEAELSRAYVALESCYFAVGRYDEELITAQCAIELARLAGDERSLGAAQIGLGTAMMKVGRTAESVAILERALPIVDRACNLAARIRIRMNLSGGREKIGGPGPALQLNREALTLAEPWGNPWAIAFILSNVVDGLLLLGEWDEAEMRAEEAAALGMEGGNAWWATYALRSYGDVLARRGRHEQAREVLQQALGVAEYNKDMQGLRVTQMVLARLDLERDEPEEAIARLEPLLDREGMLEDDATMLLPTLARAYLRLGNLSEADRTIRWLFERSEQQGAVYDIPEGMLVQAMILDGQGDGAAAVRILDDAIERARTLGLLPLQGEILLERSRMVRASGDEAAAETDQSAAEQIYERLGAPLPRV